MQFHAISTTLFVVLTFARLRFSYGYEVVYAVNCGGDTQITSNNIQYEADPGPVCLIETSEADHSFPGSVPYTDGIIFQTVRWSKKPFIYDIPIIGDGKYQLALRFFESLPFNRTSADRRRITVDINGIQIIQDMEIFADYCVEVQKSLGVRQGNLYYENQTTGITRNKVQLQFSKGSGNLPAIVSGILLVRLASNETFPIKSWLAKSNKCSQCDQQLIGCLSQSYSKPT